MTDRKLSALTAGAAVASTDLFYSAQDTSGGLGTSFNQVKQPASALAAFLGAGSSVRVQRLVTAAGAITPLAGDDILNINISSGTPSYLLPLASTRAGKPVTFKDVGGQFFAHNLTISPTGPDTIEGLASIVLSNNYAGLTLVPANDGTTAGWYVL